MMPRRIMVVEDDNMQRDAIALTLQRRFIKRRVLVESFPDAQHALERAHEADFAVVIADFRMPGLNGVAFLRALRKLQPNVVRLMLTASAEIDTAVMALNQAGVFRFIRKPWDAELVKAVEEALVQHAEASGGLLAEPVPAPMPMWDGHDAETREGKSSPKPAERRSADGTLTFD